ncbi:MAG: glycosyltransferase [Desulfarculales bacterium]|nr:glycosyltransferase [Desulfarculales bacterium]
MKNKNAVANTAEAPVLPRAGRLFSSVTLVLALVAAAVYICQYWRVPFINYNIWATSWFGYVCLISQILLAVNLLTLVWRLYLFKTYKNMPACSDPDLPRISVLVPAYNEGSQVLATLRSICASDYPREKIQVIAIDDGSKDDTWEWMVRAKAELGARVELIKQPKNGGKRHALYTGFQRASGQIWITIDSDSVVEPWGMRNLVSPFVHDARVGGVGGNVRVLNWKQGFIPKMLEIAFTFGFDFVRATHSRVNTVMCTPGAMSAFRASAVRPVMDEWLNEKFLGKPYNIGEDRNLTNLVIRQGFHILFQSNANVFTNVPVTYRSLCKMLLRWARSDVRESILLGAFIFKNFRPTGKLGARLNLLLSWIDMSVTQLILLMTLFSLLFMPLKFILLTLVMLGLGAGLTPVLIYLWRHHSLRALWGVPYVIFYFLALSWIQVYAFFTVHRSGWLTRQLPGGSLSGRSWGRWRLAPMYALSLLVAAVIIQSGPQSPMAPFSPAGPQLVAAATPIQAADMPVPSRNFSWYLMAQTNLGPQNDGLWQLGGVEMIFTKMDGSSLRLQGREAVYNPVTRELNLSGGVRMSSDDGIVLTSSNAVNFSHATLSLGSNDEVVLTGPGLNIKSKGMRIDLLDNRTYFLNDPQAPVYRSLRTAPGNKVFATLG